VRSRERLEVIPLLNFIDPLPPFHSSLTAIVAIKALDISNDSGEILATTLDPQPVFYVP